MTSGRTSRPFLVATAIALLAACASARSAKAQRAAAPASGGSERAFAVADHGRLVLSIPPGWTVEEGEEGEAGLTAIRLGRSGAGFTALLTPLWNPGEPDSPDARADAARLFAELARRAALAGSVERDLPLQEISAPGVRGFWFTATDRELAQRDPGPGEWRQILQGAAAVGPLILAFTLLDDGPGPQRAELLELVRTARHVSDGGGQDEAGDAFELMPDARTVPLRVGWPGRGWAVLVDLPGFQVGQVRRSVMVKDAVHVIGRDEETEIVVSVLLGRADGVGDARGCRDAAMKHLGSSVPELSNLRTGGDPTIGRAAYEVPASATGGLVAHAHAFLFRDGICVNVHVSKAGPEREDAARMEAILMTVRVAEDL